MQAVLYKQAFAGPASPVEVDAEALASGVLWIPCADCEGTGIYLLPDDTPTPCVACKTSGREPVNVW